MSPQRRRVPLALLLSSFSLEAPQAESPRAKVSASAPSPIGRIKELLFTVGPSLGSRHRRSASTPRTLGMPGVWTGGLGERQVNGDCQFLFALAPQARPSVHLANRSIGRRSAASSHGRYRRTNEAISDDIR